MSTLDIYYETKETKELFPEKRVKVIVKKILTLLKRTESELSLSFVSGKTIKELNRDYRNKDESTDILSFSQQSDFQIGQKELLGDLIISVDDLKDNSNYFSVDLEEELIRLLIHGILHLTGWDHQSNNSDEQMLIYQEQLLALVRKESGE